jgi:exodeoxyribonuclease V beta subunit
MRPFSVTEIPLRGRNLVDASAGTGKTYAIATLFIRLLLETELEPKQLLVVTFTEAATSELRARIRARVRECLDAARATGTEPRDLDPTLLEIMARAGDRARVVRRLKEALFDFDNVEISTIHGFCQRMLMERAFQSDVTFNSQLYGDARPLIDELILDFWATHAGPAQPELLAYMRSEGSRFSIDMARRLAYAVQRAPQVQILPASAPESPAPDFERFRAEFQRARGVWKNFDVVSLIAESSVRKTTYNRRHTPAWVQEVSEFFDKPPGLFLALPKHFDRFCSARLLESGGDSLQGHELLLGCDGLFAEHRRLDHALAGEALRFKLALLEYLKVELPRRTRQLRQLSFDDLLERLYTALHAADGDELALSIRKRYPAALIDEFQDTDPQQLGIFERIYAAPNTSLFLIGDPKQAIYSFRGADVFSYVAAARDTATDRHYTMTTNYRSDPSMVAAVNHLFSACAHPFLLSEIQFQPVSPRPHSEDVLRHPDGTLASGLSILFADSNEGAGALSSEWVTRRLPGLIANDIAAVLRSGLSCKGEPVAPGDVAVLTRTNDQAFQIQAALRAVGVTSVVLGDKSVYDSEEARDLERLLGAVVEPTSMRLIRAALTTDLLGLGASELSAMDEGEGQWESWIAAFHEYNGIWSHTGFVQMMRVLMGKSRMQERLLGFGDGERRMTNLLQLIELLHAASVEKHLGPSGLFTFLTQMRRRDAVGMEAESAQIRLESDAEAVKITTMHKSKGLEYPVVYCPYLWHGTLLHQSDEQAPKLHLDDGQLVLDIGSDDQKLHLTRARWEQFAENLRLLYVALTRARHRCTVVWGRIGRYSTSALGYLLHPPPASESAPDVATIQAHLTAQSDGTLLAELARHSAAAPIVVCRSAPPLVQPQPPSVDAEVVAPRWEARRSTRRVDDRFRTSSFSALTSHAPVALGGEELVRDHDAIGTLPPQVNVPAAPEAMLRLAEFPRGTQAGSFFHDVLEHYDFTSPRPQLLARMVEARLTSYRYPVDTWRDLVCEQVYAVLDTPLGPAGNRPFCLSDIPLAERLSELEFCLPVASRGAGDDARALSSADLAQIFRRYPSEVLSDRYADSVSRLGFVPLRGFLRGFIDLVFRHDGCYYLVDYKANHLGVHASDYGAEALGNAMLRGQYFLQYHLYALALHRYLARRVPAYSFERHFGGVYYLFVKGMGPELGSSGIFFEKPPLERLNALGRLLDQP